MHQVATEPLSASLFAEATFSPSITSSEASSSPSSALSGRRPVHRGEVCVAKTASSDRLDQSNSRTLASSVTTLDNSSASAASRPSHITIKLATYQFLEAKAVASAREIERLHALLQTTVASHTAALIEHEQQLSAAAVEKAAIAQKCQDVVSALVVAEHKVRQLFVKGQQNQAKYQILATEIDRINDVHETTIASHAEALVHYERELAAAACENASFSQQYQEVMSILLVREHQISQLATKVEQQQAEHQIFEAKALASATEVEGLRMALDAKAKSLAEAVIVNEQSAAAAASQNASLSQNCRELGSSILEKENTIDRLAITIKRQQAEICALLKEKERISRVHGAIAMEYECARLQTVHLRNAKAEAEAKASLFEANAITAEAKVAEAEGKVVEAEGRINAAEAEASQASDEAFAAKDQTNVAMQHLKQVEFAAAEAAEKVDSSERKIRSLERKLLIANDRTDMCKQAVKRLDNERMTLEQDLAAREDELATLDDSYITLEKDFTALELQTEELAQWKNEHVWLTDSNREEGESESAASRLQNAAQELLLLREVTPEYLERIENLVDDLADAKVPSEQQPETGRAQGRHRALRALKLRVERATQSLRDLFEKGVYSLCDERTHVQVVDYHHRIEHLIEIAPRVLNQEVVNLRHEMHRVESVVWLWLDDAAKKLASRSVASDADVPEPVRAGVPEACVEPSDDNIDAPVATEDDVDDDQPSPKMISWESVQMALFGYVTPAAVSSCDDPVTPTTWLVDTPAEPPKSVAKNEEQGGEGLAMTPPLTETGSDLGSDDEFFEPCDLAANGDTAVEINWAVPEAPTSGIWDPIQREWVLVTGPDDREMLEQEFSGLTPSPTCDHACDPRANDLYALMREFAYEEGEMF
ncbi:hypothetical protein QFC24_006955 [Naganishia onofrii]|uniref:Uncharacterized protein n=1 Tax=Naganishia onofrii TaxID=1851511 RepID=A0ACC2WWL5_9TREE|nr:hypothetical protein QFC24_006955 [Naganishia onofrii]